MEHLTEFVMNHALLSSAFGGVLLLTLFNEWQQNLLGANGLDPAQVIQCINRKNPVLLDLREKEPFDKGHIINSKLTSKDVANSLKQNKKNEFIIICENGTKSSTFSASFKKEGFDNVSILKGGIQAWTEENLPLETTIKKIKKKK
tara:strand:- start:67 stop:504 length:438 start_codon:yes stop_codon:yes gene_type:complete